MLHLMPRHITSSTLDGTRAVLKRCQEGRCRERAHPRSLENPTRQSQLGGGRVSVQTHEWCLIIDMQPSDDDDDEGDAEPNAEATNVKPDPDKPPKGKARARSPSDELHVYSAEELSQFRKRELIADAELLDGNKFLYCPVFVRALNVCSKRNSRTPSPISVC